MKTSELIGPALDWAVAKCEGLPVEFSNGKQWVYLDEIDGRWHPFVPSTDWAQGGPIIEQVGGFELKIWLESGHDSKCEAHIHNYEGDWIAFGPTPLIAAMRCYVASKLGDEVEIPKELLCE